MAIRDARDQRYPSTVVADGYEFRSQAHLAAWRAGSMSLREATTPFGARPPKHRVNRPDHTKFRTATQRRFG